MEALVHVVTPAVPATESLLVRPWPDPVIDALGHDPRSAYVETFWLPILGPSTTWLLRHVAAGLEAQPDGFGLELADAARRLGLGERAGRNSPVTRALTRSVQFDLAHVVGPATLAVRRFLPPLNRRQLMRLPGHLQVAHHGWGEGREGARTSENQRRRARQLALSLFELGEDLDGAERQLMRWSYHPALCRESASWAAERHRRAVDAARSGAAED
ncbi:MAG: hypothetical protein ACRD0D_12850, partial [Acidimicrobiales bacterium]